MEKPKKNLPKKIKSKPSFCRGCGSRKIISSHGRQISEFRSSFSPKNGKMFYEIWLKCPNQHWWGWLFSDCEGPTVLPYLYEEEYKLALKDKELL